MSLTPQQQHQLLLDAIEEAIRLAKKFGLNKGLQRLEKFRESLKSTESHGLLQLAQNIDPVSKDPQNKLETEKFLKAYQQRLVYFQRLLAGVFGFDFTPDTLDKELKRILYPSDKRLKKINKENDGVFDIGFVTNVMRDKFKDYIKHKFGVNRGVLLDGTEILEQRLSLTPVDSNTTIKTIVRVIELVIKNDTPQNFNFNGIRINGLYKLIKIISGIDNLELAKACVPFFNGAEQDNIQIMRAFFAAESTEQYCRKSSMLIQTLTLLVQNDHFCNDLCNKFIEKILREKDTSIKTLLTKQTMIASVTEFLVNVVNLSTYFKPILDVIETDLENRAIKASKLRVSQNTLLRSAFYFAFVSPLLKNLEVKLAEVWSPKDSQQFRLEFSLVTDLMLGLKSPEQMAKVKSSGMICPAFFELATNESMSETVRDAFAPANKGSKTKSKKELLTAKPVQQELKGIQPKRQRRLLDLDSDDAGYKADTAAFVEEDMEHLNPYTRKKAAITSNMASSSTESATGSKKSEVRQNFRKSRAVSFYHSTPSSSEKSKIGQKKTTDLEERKHLLPPELTNLSVSPDEPISTTPTRAYPEFKMKANGQITPRKEEQKSHVKTFFNIPEGPDSTLSDSSEEDEFQLK